jgi:isoquinoline 1-oxidoreductase subunit beta
VVGKDTWSAIKGRSLLRIDWDDGVHGSYDSAAFRAELEAAVLKPGGKEVRNEGDTYAALEKAAKKLQADYYVPHFAHASMEAPAATVRIAGGRCEVWAAVQSPQTARDRVAKRLDLPPEKVIVNVTLLGGGFERKSKPDFVLEAALASQAMNGQPVKLTWTREDDLHHDYFHSVAAQHLEAGLDADGKIVAWLHRASEPTTPSSRPIRSSSHPSSSGSAWSACRTPSPTSASRIRHRRRMCVPAGCARSTTSSMRSRGPSPSLRRSPMRRAGTIATTCSSCSARTG